MRRYPGVKPFETSEQAIFFGRKDDCQDLFDLISLEQIVVLFGKSGYGKSSLINAGIVPLFLRQSLDEEDNYYPLIIRFRSYTQNELYPLDKVLEGINSIHSDSEKGLPYEEGILLEKLWKKIEEPNSLWYEYKRRQPKKILLIFDQFEEFFTYPIAAQTAFKHQLAELLFTEIPPSIRKSWKELDRDLKVYLSNPPQVKVLFSIRHDKLSLLNGLSSVMPGILQKRFELEGLSYSQAMDAIKEPALIKNSNYESGEFTYSEKAINKIIEELSKGHGDDHYLTNNRAKIEAFLLQICCEYLEEKVIQTKNTKISDTDLPDFSNIYEAYYNGKIEELSEEQKTAAHHLIEEGLLYYNALTGEARRLSVDKDQLISSYQHLGINQSLLDTLKNRFLIREERNNTGGFSYEISHDTLLSSIVRARELRLQEIEKKQNRKRIRRLAIVISAAVLIIAGLSILTWWAVQQKIIADTQKKEVLQKTEELEKTLQDLRFQIFQTDKLEFEKLEQTIDVYLKANEELLARDVLSKMDSISQKYPDSLEFRSRIKILEGQIQ